LNLKFENVIISKAANVHLNVSTPATDNTGAGEVMDDLAIVYPTAEGYVKLADSNSDGVSDVVTPVSPTPKYNFNVTTTDSGVVVENGIRHYNVGDTVTAVVSLSESTVTPISGFQFKLVYDDTVLQLKSLVMDSTLAGMGNVNLASHTAIYNDTSSAMDATIFAGNNTSANLATATFTALKEGSTDITVDVENYSVVTNRVDNEDITATQSGVSIQVHDVQVTLTSDAGSKLTAEGNVSDSVTLYAKYNVAGLFSDATRETAVADTAYVATAADGYRLNNAETPFVSTTTTGGNGAQASFAAINAVQFKASETFAVTSTQLVTIAFADGENGTLSNKDSIANVDVGAAWSSITLPTATADTGYNFTGWTADGTTLIDLENGTVPAGTDGVLTLTPVFGAKTFNFTAPTVDKDEATLGAITGAGDEVNTATYGQDITIPVTPTDDYVVTGVTYTVGGDTENPKNAEKTDAGYVIPGTNILGDIAVEVSVSPIRTVLFKAGEGTTINGSTADVTLYAINGYSDLFASKDDLRAGTNKVAVPTVAAEENYRLNDDAVWSVKIGGGVATDYAATLPSVSWTADATVTSKAIATVNVNFVIAEDSTSFATFADDAKTTVSVDKGTTWADANVTYPEVTVVTGYTGSWSTAPADDAVLNDNVTLTYTAAKLQYKVTTSVPSDVTGVTVAVAGKDVTGTGTENDPYYVTHGEGPVTITVTPGSNEAVTGAKATIGPEEFEGVAGSDGTYTITIPASEVLGPIAVVVEAHNTVTITFNADDHGTIAAGQTVVITKGDSLTAEQLPEVTLDTYYEQDGWKIGETTYTTDDLLKVEFTEATTITAVTKQTTFIVTMPDGSTVEKKGGETMTIAAPSVTGEIVTGVKYLVDGETSAKNAELQKDGSYTFEVTGNTTVSYDTVVGTLRIIERKDFRSAVQGKKVAVLETSASAGAGNAFSLGKYGVFFSSSAYTTKNGVNTYVVFVDEAETVATLSPLVTVVEGENKAIDYSGDVNGDSKVTVSDSNAVLTLLLVDDADQTYTIDDAYRFRADVTADEKVTVNDAETIQDAALQGVTVPQLSASSSNNG
jgi:hypothetical protein